jgi:uncharacterized protein YkwD
MSAPRNEARPVRLSLGAIAAGLLLAGAMAAPASASTETPPDTWPETQPETPADARVSSMEQRALDKVNAQRAAKGCAPLVVDSHLQKAAHAYASEMVRTHSFSHTSATGKSPGDRAEAAGYTRGGVGENIAMGFRGDPNGVVNDPEYGWMHSAAHRANILDCAYTRTGIGYDPGNVDPEYAKGSWVQMFG